MKYVDDCLKDKLSILDINLMFKKMKNDRQIIVYFGERLFLYVAIANSSVAFVLHRECKNKHMHVYYVIKVLNRFEFYNYNIQKIVYFGGYRSS